jgi:hypothetical protein
MPQTRRLYGCEGAPIAGAPSNIKRELAALNFVGFAFGPGNAQILVTAEIDVIVG